MKTLVATPDPEWCPECAKSGRFEPLNANVRHRSGPYLICQRVWWCFVCGTGGAELIDCDEYFCQA